MNEKHKEAAKICIVYLLMPLFLLSTLLQYFMFYTMEGSRWVSNKCTRLYNYLGSPWYHKKDKKGVYYRGTHIAQIYSLVKYRH